MCYKAVSSSDINPVCTFVNPELLQTVSKSSKASHHAQKAAARTLDIDIKLRSSRLTAPREVRGAGVVGGARYRVIYDCRETEVLPGTRVREENDEKVKDRSVNNSYNALGIAFNFFHSLFNHDLINSLPLKCSVHYGKDYNNAIWNGEQMVFGDGDGEVFNYFSDSLDVVVHEFTHAVTQYTANLEYRDQAGALNESMSDVFACMAEQWHFGQTSDQGDWIVGQNLFPLSRKGVALRSLKDPGKAYEDDFGKDSQVAHMRYYIRTSTDNGGVHKYSGIPNHAFYRAAIELGGNSWERAGKIWSKTLTDPRLGPRCTFREFADLTINIADDLFDSSVGATVRSAWVSVGVLP
ncbi:hypothetical protein BDW71DRAFT_201173 [Aspergillus fruticulosus]